LILLIADGLNERADVDWRPFLASLLADPWRQSVTVLATDRPHHWRTKCSRAGVSAIDEITVGCYSQPELDRALAANGLSHKDIPDGLRPLVSIPRYCGLVANHYKEMIETGDFTRERLIYIDIKDRQASKLGYPLTEQQLNGIIRDLAQRARLNPELDPKELRPLIAVPGGDEANIYEELVSGGLLVPIPAIGGTENFAVEPLRLVYGFGMLLASELAERSSTACADEIEEFLTSWFEPQPDMDRKVDICGSAMFHALCERGFPESALRELIRYWLSLRNWADSAQFAFAGYVVRCPRIFLEVAEDFWSSTHDIGAAQQFLGAALATHRDDPRLQPLLAAAIERWMGFIHPLGHRYWTFNQERIRQSREAVERITGQRVINATDEAANAERVRQEIEGRAGCPVVPGEIEVAGTTLTVISDGALLRLARLGLMVMSAGDPSPFVHSLVKWAVASAVMEDSDFGEIASWVIRLSDRDVDSVLVERARYLLSRSEGIASAAAWILLRTIGTKESESLISAHSLTPEWLRKQRSQHAADPCRSFYAWTESETLPCLAREDVALHIILGRAVLPIIDPSTQLPNSMICRAQEWLGAINPAAIRAASSKTVELHHLEAVTQVLCARAPSELAEFMRRVVRTMADRDLTGKYYLGIRLPELSLLLKSQEVDAVSQAVLDLSTGAPDWSLQDHSGPRHMEKIAEARAFSGIAPHLSPSELFKRLTGRSANAYDLVGLELWFGPVAQAEAREAALLLDAPPNEATLHRVLWMLPHLGVVLSESDRERLISLADSKDAKARAGAMRVAVVAQDESLGRRILDLDRSVDRETDTWEERWLTLLIARFGAHLRFEDLAKRLRPSAIGFLVAQRGNRPDEVEMYADCLDQEWQRIISAADPAIDALPEITIELDSNDAKESMPQLHEHAKSEAIRLGRSNSWTSGPPTDPEVQLKEMFSRDYEKQARQLFEDRRSKVNAILAAWRTEAFQWYGREFSLDAMEALYERQPARVEYWVRPALAESATGLAVRVRLGSFLEPICRVLLNRKPPLGLALWRVLRNRDICPIVFDTTDIAFRADSSESSLARKAVLDDCWTDAAIGRVALACGRWKRQAWIEETTEELISSGRLWKRAKGLTLASLSDMTPERFEEFVSTAAVDHTWVEHSLGHLRENVRKNHLARHWYHVFLTSDDSDTAWGALQIVLAHADERLLNWCEEMESECVDNALRLERLRFLGLGWHSRRDLRKEIDRDNERREKLFGLRIQPGEIVPFMTS
jgi:hypothetical protein